MPRVIRVSASVNAGHFTLSLCERVEFVSELNANLQIRERGATHVALLVNIGKNLEDTGLSFMHVALPVDVGEDFVDFDVGIAHKTLSPRPLRERARVRGKLRFFATRNDALKLYQHLMGECLWHIRMTK